MGGEQGELLHTLHPLSEPLPAPSHRHGALQVQAMPGAFKKNDGVADLSSVVDPDSLNLNPDPAFQVNPDTDPDPGF